MADQPGQQNPDHPPAEGHELPPVSRLLQAPSPPSPPPWQRGGIAVIIGLLSVLIVVLLIVILRG